MGLHERRTYQATCDRCGYTLRDDWPGMPMQYDTTADAEADLRLAGWLGPDESATRDGDLHDGDLIVCTACQKAMGLP